MKKLKTLIWDGVSAYHDAMLDFGVLLMFPITLVETIMISRGFVGSRLDTALSDFLVLKLSECGLSEDFTGDYHVHSF